MLLSRLSLARVTKNEIKEREKQETVMRLVKATRKCLLIERVSDWIYGRKVAASLPTSFLPVWAYTQSLGSLGVFLTVTLNRLRSPQGHLRDQYGHLVNIYTKLLLTKISFHLKVVSLRNHGTEGLGGSSLCDVLGLRGC